MTVAKGEIAHCPDWAPADCGDVTGEDLREILDAYVDACWRSDLVDAIAWACSLSSAAMSHVMARVVETEHTSITWAQIGEPFGMTAWQACDEFGGHGEGPLWPDSPNA